MFESHRPFVMAVLNRTNEFTSSEIESFLKGEIVRNKLSMMFGAWTRGNSAQMTMFAELPDKAVDFIKDYVDEATYKANSTNQGGLGQDRYIEQALDLLKRKAEEMNYSQLGKAAENKSSN